MPQFIRWFDRVSMADLEQVGGKNASIGEMISHLSALGVNVPTGFATTAEGYRHFLTESGLSSYISQRLAELDVDDIQALSQVGEEIRTRITTAALPEGLEHDIRTAYAQMPSGVSVAVRSSATAEDLPEASFAGQQETFLNVEGIDEVLIKIREVFASLFNDRAIAYRVHQGFAHDDVALSAGVQQMVRSDKGVSGVMFTLDTESGYRDAIFVTAAYGLGELVVQGAINPDEYYLYKPGLRTDKHAILSRKRGSKQQKMIFSTSPDKLVESIDTSEAERASFCMSDADLTALAQQALLIEDHYGKPMDIEWAKDGLDGRIYILQARPETVQSHSSGRVLTRYQLVEKGPVLTIGRSVGNRIGAGAVRIITHADEMDKVSEGDVLVADMTDPDWEPVMRRASAIVTNRGGRTCHAAIIAREFGIPAVVGTSDATEVLTEDTEVTVSCAEGDEGYVYQGKLDFNVMHAELDQMPELDVKIMMNVASPERAFSLSRLPNHGVGLARLEFIINNVVGIHPRALLDYPNVPEAVRTGIETRISGYSSPETYYVHKLAEGISTIAAAFAPKPVIVRLSDFKSNEYRNLLGGPLYEPQEENPMIGFRGASRYRDTAFRPAFNLEIQALKLVREQMGIENIQVMVPFVRTLEEAKEVIDILAQEGLKRGENGLSLIMMCEVPSNALLAEEFLTYFDGFSIGSNDLTQFTLALDRDSAQIAPLFDEKDPAVKAMIALALKACQKNNKYIGICGQGPSDHPDFALWLKQSGISSISLNPDTVLSTWLHLANAD